MSDRPADADDTLAPNERPTVTGGAFTSGSSRQIGPYRLLDKLGEGGMGEVWLAEQTEPVSRKVALKVVKQGMDTKQVVARFEAERQALAMMDHPVIAKVYDAGATPRGRPYFAMEYVPGVPITEHCDRHRLTNRERLELFGRVCEGVQHAHQKAVIHRDLKPSNVLVSVQDDKPMPKIIDFGVAKAIGQKLTAKTMHTQLGVMIGTPAYMSPEQAELTGQGVDTRTDVYALGVMLYELLVGALPFDSKELEQGGFERLARRIREDDPPKPSTRLSTLGEQSTESAKARRTDLGSLKRQLSGDLDWIALRAMEKDRTRRYSSPQDLAADIRRYLADEPVLATPPSAVYRAKKFVRRHTWGVGAAAAGLLLLAAFAVAMAVQAKRIVAERDTARRAQADLESVAAFQARMLSSTDPAAMGRRLMDDVSNRFAELRLARGDAEDQVAAARADLGEINATDVALKLLDEDILRRAVEALDEEFSDRPLIDARLRHTIGWMYRDLGIYERAEPQLAKALELQKRELGPDHPDTLQFMNDLAVLLLDQGSVAEAEPLLLETLETRRRVLGEDHPATLQSMNNLASLYWNQGRYADVEPLLTSIVAIRKRVLGAENSATLNAMSNLAGLYAVQGRYTDAEPLMLETLEARRRVLGEDHPATLGSMSSLAASYSMQGRYADAEPLTLATLEAQKRSLGSEHPDTLLTANNLARVYEAQGRYAEAEQLLVAALETTKRVLGPEHWLTLTTMNNLGGLYTKEGDLDRAATLLQKTVDARLRVFGPDHLHMGYSHYNLACLSAVQGRREEALDHLRKAVASGWRERVIFEDAELDPLRGDPQFESILDEVRETFGEK